MSHYYTIAPKGQVPATAGGAAAHPQEKEPDRIYPANDVEKEAAKEAAKRTQWHAKGHGRGAYIEMFCPLCSLQTTIENPSLNASVFHCGKKERCPEKVYEQLCILRDNNGRP